ncbi:MAG: DUF952 domain-containing protein [Pseudomonadota bacterium]
MTSTIIYKICTQQEWEEAVIAGIYHGSSVDRQDGFIHFSTAEQVRETAEKHFVGQADLVLVACESERIGPYLRWEPSRNDALFPHLYGVLPVDAAVSVMPLDLSPQGVPLVPDLSASSS